MFNVKIFEYATLMSNKQRCLKIFRFRNRERFVFMRNFEMLNNLKEENDAQSISIYSYTAIENIKDSESRQLLAINKKTYSRIIGLKSI